MAQTKSSLMSPPGDKNVQPWHKSAFRFQALSMTICLVMIICYILSSTSTHGGAVGTTQLYSGQCSHAVNINRVLQAVLSLLAIGVSVSSDFFIRLVSSPTVEDLRKAHTQGRSFDIGIHSLQNVRQIPYWRISAWVILILLAIPIQLLLHSIIFVCFSSTDYSVFFVSEAFTTGQAFNYPGVAFLDKNAFNPASGLRSRFDEVLPDFRFAATSWNKLEIGDCSSTYYKDPAGLQRHRNLLVVVEGPDADVEGWTGAHVWMHQPRRPPAYTDRFINEYDPDLINEYDPDLANSLWSFAVDCRTDRSGESDNTQFTSCRGSQRSLSGREDERVGVPVRDPSSIFFNSYSAASCSYHICAAMNSSFEHISVKYCLSEPYSAPCKLYVSNLFLLVTMICILLGCVFSILVARVCWNEDTCQSLGDALQVFLKHGETFSQIPSALVAGCSPEGAAPLSNDMKWTQSRQLKDYRAFWAQAVSKRVWIWAYVPIGSVVLGGSVALFTMRNLISGDYVLGESLNNRYLTIYTSSPSGDTTNTFAPSSSTLQLATICLIVNAPQLCVSSCYFTFTSLYSTLFQAQYWGSFSIRAQPLRVSFPREQQEQTPALQFPLPWGLSFIILKAAIEISEQNQEIEFERADMFVGYSMQALVLTVAVAALAASIPLFLSARRLPSSSDIVGTDSAALLAYCPTNMKSPEQQGTRHGQQNIITAWDGAWRSRRHLQPLRWGVLKSPAGDSSLGLRGTVGLGTEDEVLGLPDEEQSYVSITGQMKLYLPSLGSTWVKAGFSWWNEYVSETLE